MHAFLQWDSCTKDNPSKRPTCLLVCQLVATSSLTRPAESTSKPSNTGRESSSAWKRARLVRHSRTHSKSPSRSLRMAVAQLETISLKVKSRLSLFQRRRRSCQVMTSHRNRYYGMRTVCPLDTSTFFNSIRRRSNCGLSGSKTLRNTEVAPKNTSKVLNCNVDSSSMQFSELLTTIE